MTRRFHSCFFDKNALQRNIFKPIILYLGKKYCNKQFIDENN